VDQGRGPISASAADLERAGAFVIADPAPISQSRRPRVIRTPARVLYGSSDFTFSRRQPSHVRLPDLPGFHTIPLAKSRGRPVDRRRRVAGRPDEPRPGLARTNVIESAFSIKRVCANVKPRRWRSARTLGEVRPLSGREAFRRVQGHKQIPILLRELEVLVPSKMEVANAGRESGLRESRYFQGESGERPSTMFWSGA